MARPVWKGAISFSLINVPVSLHTASSASTIDLDLLDKRDFSPVGYQRINKATGRVVDWKNIVKGYQYEKGEYVVLTDEDFRRANVEASRTIDIQAFVETDSIEPYYFETPYYLMPERNGEKVYALLRDALTKSKKLAVATFVMRTRQHIAALMPVDDMIVLITLRYAPEIRAKPESEKKGKSVKVAHATAKELQVALKLIDEMSEPWKPKQYRDTYREDLMKRIKQKVSAGQTKTLTAPEKEKAARPAGGKVVDLMSLLERSLEERRMGGAASTPTAHTRRRSAGRRSSRARAARRA